MHLFSEINGRKIKRHAPPAPPASPPLRGNPGPGTESQRVLSDSPSQQLCAHAIARARVCSPHLDARARARGDSKISYIKFRHWAPLRC